MPEAFEREREMPRLAEHAGSGLIVPPNLAPGGNAGGADRMRLHVGRTLLSLQRGLRESVRRLSGLTPEEATRIREAHKLVTAAFEAVAPAHRVREMIVEG